MYVHMYIIAVKNVFAYLIHLLANDFSVEQTDDYNVSLSKVIRVLAEEIKVECQVFEVCTYIHTYMHNITNIK